MKPGDLVQLSELQYEAGAEYKTLIGIITLLVDNHKYPQYRCWEVMTSEGLTTVLETKLRVINEAG